MSSNSDQPTAVISGATSGFGQVIAQHLVMRGYRLIVLARNEDKAKELISRLAAATPDSNPTWVKCDLSSFRSIQLACNKVLEKKITIDLLVLNAGLWNFEFKETEDGIEETLQVNLLAPYLILKKLLPIIRKSGESKVIFTASGLHQGKVNFDDIEFRKRFSGFKTYRQSKLGIILLTKHLSQIEEFAPISYYCVHPGMVNTDLGRSAGWLSRLIFRILGKSLEKGAQTHLHLIDTPSSELVSGAYYANAKVSKSSKESFNLGTAGRLHEVIEQYISNTSAK